MNNKIDLSIILPVYNEEKNIPSLVEKYLAISKKKKIELIFVEDGGSLDNTKEILNIYKKKYSFVRPIFISEKGYGISIYRGLQKARGEYICWTHADLQTDPEDTIKALEIIIKQNNPKLTLVKGSRHGRALFDSFFTFGMSLFESIYLSEQLYDINAQPNLFHNSFLKEINNPPKDFSFDLYIYYLFKRRRCRVIRFPVFFRKRVYGSSAWNTGIKSKMKFIKRTVKFTFELKKYLI